MTEQEAFKLLAKVVNDYRRYCETPEALAHRMLLYGGDRTCLLIEHYGDELLPAIKNIWSK